MLRGTLSTIVAATAAVSALAQTVTLSATSDARILGFFPGSNFGNDILSTYTVGPNVQRTLILFDLGSIPSGQIITSATLRLYGSPFFASSDPATTSVYRATNSWIESQVTWNSSSTGNPWLTVGGTFVGTTGVQGANPYATLTGNQTEGWREWNVTSLVSEWKSGTHSNHGFAITGSEGTTLVYTSREGTSTSLRPQLIVSYEPVPEPFTLGVVGLGALAIFRRKKS
ncbi:MAG: DNRLRE domain-containing protein [Fimbriimonadaceae bacterium]|jgi:hypothetical protein|nr:DNRLRE domain-containing protein [Fimbriimonadaceae bacterium]